MLTLIIFLVVLSVLVISHEYGHFLTARKNGIKVHEFGFGFPPRLVGVARVTTTLPNGDKKQSWRWVWGGKEIPLGLNETSGTIYSFNIIPLGGFVKIKGENSNDPDARDADSFLSKKTWQKALVLVAGVGMNVIVAFILLTIGFMIGLPQITDAIKDQSAVHDRKIQILQTLAGKPAALSDIKPGDSIIKIGPIERPRVTELQEYITAHKNETVSLTIERDHKLLTKEVKPVVENNKGLIGVAIAEVGLVRYPWWKAPYYGMQSTGEYLREIVLAFYRLFKGLATGQGAGEAVSGPVGVAVTTGQVARLGFSYLLQFTALLSLNLAILNILPIPALDGGRLLFVLIGHFFRRVQVGRFEQTAHTLGFLALMALVVIITVRDIGNLTGGFRQLLERLF